MDIIQKVILLFHSLMYEEKIIFPFNLGNYKRKTFSYPFEVLGRKLCTSSFSKFLGVMGLGCNKH